MKLKNKNVNAWPASFYLKQLNEKWLINIKNEFINIRTPSLSAWQPSPPALVGEYFLCGEDNYKLRILTMKKKKYLNIFIFIHLPSQ